MNIKEYFEIKKELLRREVSQLSKKPVFVIVQANDDPASDSYIRGKIKDADQIGVIAKLLKLSSEISEQEILKVIDDLNKDKEVDGFIVQLPLPKQINEEKIKLAINPKKDVDGFHPLSALSPCTPKGILGYLKALGERIEGKNALVIGRSNIVGKPMAKLLLKENANVVVLHSKTSFEDMKKYVSIADIIVIAIGKQHFLDQRFAYNKNAVIIDVGINKDGTGLHGDALPDLPVRLQTPVPGGVGLLTRLALLENLLEVIKNGISNQ